MKAALNGALNVSVLDGWWAEGYDGSNGWAIDSRENGDVDAQDGRDANALADLLEREIIPLFHERDRDGLPRGWLKMVRSSIRTAGLRFSSRRMLDDYVARVYFPPAT
jgi:starch phosphorylase